MEYNEGRLFNLKQHFFLCGLEKKLNQFSWFFHRSMQVRVHSFIISSNVFFLSLYLPSSKGVDNQCICISNKVAKRHLLILCSITKLNERLWKLNRFMARCILVSKKIESPMQPLIYISRCIITIMYAHIEDENVSSS